MNPCRARNLGWSSNIIPNSWAATISNLSAFKMSLPMVIRGDSNPMFESATTKPSPVPSP